MEGTGGREPGRTGAGEGGKLENRRREAGEEINKAIVCCILLGIIQSKHLSSKVLKFPFNIRRCLKENFGSKTRA